MLLIGAIIRSFIQLAFGQGILNNDPMFASVKEITKKNLTRLICNYLVQCYKTYFLRIFRTFVLS